MPFPAVLWLHVQILHFYSGIDNCNSYAKDVTKLPLFSMAWGEV